MSEWCVEHHQAHPAPPAQEHVLAAVGVLGPAPPLQMHMELLAGIPAQALLDALAQKSKAELGQFSQDLCKVSEKLGKRLVPIRDEKISPDRCVRCHTIHARCDGKRPCGRCLSRNLEAQCVFHTDPDYVPRQRRSRQRRKRPFEEDLSDSVGESVPPPPSSPPSDGLEQAAPRRQKRDGKANVRPARREGVTASGDILCPHGIEKRYCLDQGCLANGGGKAMCQHGRRRRVCKEPECKAETERKRQEMEARRCIHGRQKRLCREGDCIKEFSEASKAYREMVHQRRSEVLQHSIKHPAVRAVRKLCEHPGSFLYHFTPSDGRARHILRAVHAQPLRRNGPDKAWSQTAASWRSSGQNPTDGAWTDFTIKNFFAACTRRRITSTCPRPSVQLMAALVSRALVRSVRAPLHALTTANLSLWTARQRGASTWSHPRTETLPAPCALLEQTMEILSSVNAASAEVLRPVSRRLCRPARACGQPPILEIFYQRCGNKQHC